MMDDQSDANMIKSLIEWPNFIWNTSLRVIRIVFKFFYRPVSMCSPETFDFPMKNPPRSEMGVRLSTPV